MSTEAIRGGSEIIRGFANGQADGVAITAKRMSANSSAHDAMSVP